MTKQVGFYFFISQLHLVAGLKSHRSEKVRDVRLLREILQCTKIAL